MDFEHDKTWLYANKKRQIWSGHKEILPHMMKLVEKTESIHFSSLPYFAQFGDILTETVTWTPAFLKHFVIPCEGFVTFVVLLFSANVNNMEEKAVSLFFTFVF